MKKTKFVSIIGSCALAASMVLTGCSAGTAGDKDADDQEIEEMSEDEDQTTAEQTTEAVDDEEQDELPGEQGGMTQFNPNPAPAELYTGIHPSTGGNIEGQQEYMMELLPMDQRGISEMPEDMSLHDLDMISDPDLRELAQHLSDEGYTIEDPKLDMQYGFGLPCDDEYIFNNGFYACIDGAELLQCFSACKMNEELFNYYLVGYFRSDDPTITDDGTVIRYSSGNDYIEYDRETGIGIYYTEDDMTYGVG